MEKRFDKLVRDNVPDIIVQDGKEPLTRMVEGDDFEEMLKMKLREESEEFIDAGKTDELVDILEIVYKFADMRGISKEDLEGMRREKTEKRGGFDRGIVLESVVSGEE